MDLLGEERHEKWKQTMAAADRMRDKFGDSAVSLGTEPARQIPRAHA